MDLSNKPIVVAGLVCVDITPQFDRTVSYDPHTFFQPGKLIRTEGVTVSAGGAVSNTGLALAKLGAKVHLMYMVAEDAFGDLITQQLESYHVPVTRLVTDQAATSYTVVLALPGHDRLFLHDVGANDIVTADDFDYDVIRDTCIFHFGYPQSMRQFYRDGAEDLIRMYRRVHEMGVVTSMDMALAEASSESGQMDWPTAVRQVLPYVDFFEPSLEELCISVDPENYARWDRQARAVGKAMPELVPRSYVMELADRLMEWGARVVLIKCGSKGMYLRTAPQDRLDTIGGGLAENLRGWGDQKLFLPCFQVEHVCSGTGAGDTSIAGFLYAIQRGFPLRRCVELAAATGATCVTSYDALSAIGTLDSLNEKIEQGWAFANLQE